jgi:hypothetical protein
MPDRELLVRIVGDDRDLQRALGNTNRRLEQIDTRTQTFGRNIGRAFAAAGIALGTAEVFRLAGDAVDAASALNEEISKSQQVFGASSEAIEDWSQTTASAFGISQRAALEATGVFGNLFRVVDIAPDQAADMSRALVELAADLSSFNNADPSDVLQALRSGLIGEVEPLRRFGVLLSEARVQQVAMAQTGKDNVKELTNQEKALARYQIILRDTAPAQGDFARTSEGLANQSRVLRANLDDLSANIGSVLVPVLTDATDAANLLFIALDRFRGVDFSPGFDFPDPPDWLTSAATVAPISPLGGVALGIKKVLEDDAKELELVGRDVRSERGVEAIDNLREEAERRRDKARDAAQAVARANREFRAFVKSMGLKLDRAGLTADLGDDIDVLRELEAAILRAIEREGRTFELVERLTNTRLQINALVTRQAEDARQAGEDAFNATLDVLNLNLERAEETAGLRNDISALRAIEQAILNRIQAEGETTDLMRQLFQVRQEQKEVAQRLADQRREQRRGRQFEALGLTAEGEERTPGIGAIRRRGRNLIDELQQSGLDEQKVAEFVKRISVIFTDQFDNAGKEVRNAILDFFQTINQALDQGGKQGPLTATTALNTKKLLQGLGLSPEEINALRGRLSSFNSAGVAPAGFLSPGLPSANLPTGFATPVVVESHVTVTLDGKKVGQSVTKEQQKARRRNPRQKRGPNRRGGDG